MTETATSTELEKVLEPNTPETTTVESGADSSVEKDGGKGKANWIPKSRLDEVIGQRDKYATQLENLDGELKKTAESLRSATDLLAAKEEDTRIVTELRRLAHDPKARPLLEKLDKMVQGIEEEVEEGKTTPEEGQKKTLDLIQQTRDELAGELANQRADFLLARADSLAARFLAELPSEYAEDDKKHLAEMWTERVDWKGIEADPNTLPSKLAESLQQVLDIYGEPKGLLRQQLSTRPTSETVTQRTAEDEMKELMEKDYGALKQVTLPSGLKRLEPTVSDEEFDKAIAKAIRFSHQ